MIPLLCRERAAVCGDHVWIANTQFWALLNNNRLDPATRAVVEKGYCYADVKSYTSVASRVKARATQIDVFTRNLLLIPINYVNTHWALAALDLKNKAVTYYDSLRGAGPADHICRKLLRWLR